MQWIHRLEDHTADDMWDYEGWDMIANETGDDEDDSDWKKPHIKKKKDKVKKGTKGKKGKKGKKKTKKVKK